MKKNLFYILIILTLIDPLKIQSQACSQWIKSAPGDLSSNTGDMAVDASDNIYLTGKDQYFLAKYDNNGNLVWNKAKTGLTANDLVMASSGDIYVTGEGGLLYKFDAAGNEPFPAINITNAAGQHICEDNTGIYVFGAINGSAVFGTNTYSSGSFIAKFNSGGQLLWSQNIIGTSSNTGFGNGLISDGSAVYLAGNANNTVVSCGTVSSASITGVSLIKINYSGSVNWIKEVYHSTGFGTNAFVNDMAFDNSHYINAVGYQGSGFTFSTRFDTSGTPQSSGAGGPNFNLHVKINNNNFCCASWDVGTPNNRFISVGTVGGGGTTFVLDFPYSSSTQLHHLIGLSPSGTMYAALPNSFQAYVDMNTISNVFPGNIILVKFNKSNRLLPDYNTTPIACGDSVHLGPNISSYPSWIQSNFSSGSGTSFTWTPASGLSSTSIYNPSAAPNSTVTYSVSTSPACSQLVNIPITNASAFSYTTNGMVATFSLTNSTCSSFVWDFGNGNTSSINPNPVVTYATSGTYGVCIKCNNQPNSCVKCINISVPSNQSGGIGIEELALDNFVSVTPNPLTSEAFVQVGPDNANGTARVIDIQGKIVAETNYSAQKFILTKGKMNAGLYFLHILNAKGELVSVKKIIIE